MRIWTSIWWLSPGGGRTLEQREYTDSMSGLRAHYFELRECACVVHARSEKTDLAPESCARCLQEGNVLFEDETWQTPRLRDGVAEKVEEKYTLVRKIQTKLVWNGESFSGYIRANLPDDDEGGTYDGK